MASCFICLYTYTFIQHTYSLCSEYKDHNKHTNLEEVKKRNNSPKKSNCEISNKKNEMKKVNQHWQSWLWHYMRVIYDYIKLGIHKHTKELSDYIIFNSSREWNAGDNSCTRWKKRTSSHPIKVVCILCSGLSSISRFPSRCLYSHAWQREFRRPQDTVEPSLASENNTNRLRPVIFLVRVHGGTYYRKWAISWNHNEAGINNLNIIIINFLYIEKKIELFMRNCWNTYFYHKIPRLQLNLYFYSIIEKSVIKK